MDRERWRKLLVGDFSVGRLVRSLVTIYVLLAGYLYVAADGMIFLPQPASYHDGPGILKLPTADGQRISAAYFPNPRATYTILYSHGNAEDMGENFETMAKIAAAGFAVLIYDYHGYGTSPGTPGEATAALDIEAAYAHLMGPRGVAPNRVIAYGRSVGGGPTLELVGQHRVAGVILESTFTSAVDVRFHLPFRIFPFDKFPSLARIRTLATPVLVMHGREDTLIPFSHGEALYAAAPGPKQHLWIAGAGHDDFKEVAGDRWRQALIDFAKKL